MFKHILVPLDGSQLAERALEPALTLAQQVNGRVLLLQVPVVEVVVQHPVTGYGVLWLDESIEHAQKEAKQYLANIQRKHHHPNVTIEVLVEEGDAANLIVDTAVAQGIDLIVMSTHGRSGLDRWMMGSVTAKVLQRAPCPVLAIRQVEPIEQILIPLDGSKMSEAALEPGLALAQLLGAKVTVLRVEEGFSDIDQRDLVEIERLEPGLGQQVTEGLFNRVPIYLEKLTEKLANRGVVIETAVAQGNAAEYILHVAENVAADVIVMATHGHAGLRRWIYGSVTDKIMRHTHRAMLIVRPPASNYQE